MQEERAKRLHVAEVSIQKNQEQEATLQRLLVERENEFKRLLAEQKAAHESQITTLHQRLEALHVSVSTLWLSIHSV